MHERYQGTRQRSERPSAALLEQAEEVVRAIIGCFALLSDDAMQPPGEPPLDGWLAELGQLSIARPFAMPPRCFIEAREPPSGHVALGTTPAALLALCRESAEPVAALVPFAGAISPHSPNDPSSSP